MTNDNPDGLFGKHECGVCAVAICKACESASTWNVCFEVPNRGEPHHIGFTHLIHNGHLRPVPACSFAWVVSKSFLERMSGRHELADSLGPNHGLYAPERSEPERGELAP